MNKNDTGAHFNEESVIRKGNRYDCPLNKEELGNKAWCVLHTMVAYYPESPTSNDEQDMQEFLRLFCRFYPCRSCSTEFGNLLVRRAPETGSQKSLSEWLCWAHNEINSRLGKSHFECSLLDERWKLGWKDGSCG